MSLLPRKVKNTIGDVVHLFATDPMENNLCGPVMLVDPSPYHFDYRAGVVEGRAFGYLLAMHTQGRSIKSRKRLSPYQWCGAHPVAMWLSICTYATAAAIATAGSFYGFLPAIIASWMLPVASIAALVGWGPLVRRVNRRTDLLYRALGPQLRDLTPGSELTKRVIALRGLIFSLAISPDTARGVKRDALKAGIFETSEVLYAAARAIDEHSPELEAAVVERIGDLFDRMDKLRREVTVQPPALAIEVPAPARTVAELTQSLTGDAEPMHVEYDADPVITAYPHSQEPHS